MSETNSATLAYEAQAQITTNGVGANHPILSHVVVLAQQGPVLLPHLSWPSHSCSLISEEEAAGLDPRLLSSLQVLIFEYLCCQFHPHLPFFMLCHLHCVAARWSLCCPLFREFQPILYLPRVNNRLQPFCAWMYNPACLPDARLQEQLPGTLPLFTGPLLLLQASLFPGFLNMKELYVGIKPIRGPPCWRSHGWGRKGVAETFYPRTQKAKPHSPYLGINSLLTLRFE